MKGFAVRGGAVIRGIVAVVALLGALRLPAAAVAQEVPAEAGAAGEADTRPPLHVLFIGNSLTYVNDLPAVFAALAEAAGRARPFVRAVTGPGLSLEDQWNRGDAQKAIAVGGWDYVVLQQGPSASSEGVTVLRAYAARYAVEIRKAGARPVLYMVWPSRSRFGDFDGVAQSYRGAAKFVDGLLCPAGEAWRAAWKRDPKLALYSEDGLHPTAAGTYLAALTFVDLFYGAPAGRLPARLTISGGAAIEVPAGDAAVLQAAAAEAVARWSR